MNVQNAGRRAFANRAGIAAWVFGLLNPFVFLATLVSTFAIPMAWGNRNVLLLIAAVMALPMVFYFLALTIMRLDWRLLKAVVIFGGFVALYRWMASVNARNDPGNMINWHWALSAVLLVLLFVMNRMAENLAPLLPNRVPAMRINMNWGGVMPNLLGRWASLTTTQKWVSGLLMTVGTLSGIWPGMIGVYLFFRWSGEEEPEVGQEAEAQEAPQEANEAPRPQPVRDAIVPVSDAWRRRLADLEAGDREGNQDDNDYTI